MAANQTNREPKFKSSSHSQSILLRTQNRCRKESENKLAILQIEIWGEWMMSQIELIHSFAIISAIKPIGKQVHNHHPHHLILPHPTSQFTQQKIWSISETDRRGRYWYEKAMGSKSWRWVFIAEAKGLGFTCFSGLLVGRGLILTS